jgi:hypothetical protein
MIRFLASIAFALVLGAVMVLAMVSVIEAPRVVWIPVNPAELHK